MPISNYYNSTFTLQTVTQTDDNLGNVAETWADSVTGILCLKRTLAVQKRTTNDKQEFTISDKFWTPNRAINIETNRIKHDEKYYTIVAVIPAVNQRTGVCDHVQIQALQEPEDN